RGPAGRARAIRAALAAGWDEAAFTAAVAAGDPFCRQLALPVVVGIATTAQAVALASGPDNQRLGRRHGAQASVSATVGGVGWGTHGQSPL
ncbi:MAG TPA: hypothetical protein VHN80_04025, partial [Kineosporiaceae bacterium]|nr:hypothetical protein [Kineosporiaceae bacterium]